MQVHSTTRTSEDPDVVAEKCLLPEPPLVVCPTLACLLGVNEAVFIQQVHYWLRKSEGRCHQGRKWIYNSYPEWHEQMPWVPVETIRKIVSRLKATGMLLTEQLNIKRGDARLWYTLDYANIRKEFGDVFDAAKAAQGQGDGVVGSAGWGGQNDRMGWSETPDGVVGNAGSYIETENTTENTTYISTPPTIPPTEPEVEELVGGGEINCEDVVEIKERRDPYQDKASRLPPYLALKLEEFLPLAKERRTRSPYPFQPGEEVWGYLDPLFEECEKENRRFSDEALAYGLDEAISGNGQRFGYVIKAAGTYEETLAREGKPPVSRRYYADRPTGRGAPKARHHGENSPAAAANRSEGTDVINRRFSPEIEESLKQLEDMRKHVDDEEFQINYEAIMERAREERINA